MCLEILIKIRLHSGPDAFSIPVNTSRKLNEGFYRHGIQILTLKIQLKQFIL